MVVSLNIPDLLKDIKAKSHYEVQEIADVEARYRAQAGTEKEYEILHEMARCASALSRRVRRFLIKTYQEEADSGSALPTSFVFEFDFADRRLANNAQPLADAMHDYLVHYTLSRFYATVSQTELSNKHSLLTADAESRIEYLIYTKQAPE